MYYDRWITNIGVFPFFVLRPTSSHRTSSVKLFGSEKKIIIITKRTYATFLPTVFRVDTKNQKTCFYSIVRTKTFSRIRSRLSTLGGETQGYNRKISMANIEFKINSKTETPSLPRKPIIVLYFIRFAWYV